jgi:hypothetical protein
MFIKLSNRAAPIVFLVLSCLWMAVLIGTLIYSVLFPARDIQRIVRTLGGRDALHEDLAPLVQPITSAVGQLKTAIQVGAYWHASADYKLKESHTTREIQFSYLAWFEKRSNVTLLRVTRTQTDSSQLHFDIGEGDPYSMLRVYLYPALALALSAYWFRRRWIPSRKEPPSL